MALLRQSSIAPGFGRMGLALAVAVVLLALGPFGAALEIHHALAAADRDGHQHSDTDLCQWVQHHTGSSVLTDPPVLCSTANPDEHPIPASIVAPSAQVVRLASSRAPPVF